MTGREPRRELEEALPVIREKALRGNAWAKYLVGAAHDFALADWGEARRWYTEAAELGNVLAQDGLGHIYADGRGTPEDGAQAARWFQAAANQGYAPSESMLGWLYDTGRGVGQNPAEAKRWFAAAAAQGDAAGQANLGSLYDRGRGTPEIPTSGAVVRGCRPGLAFAQYRLGTLRRWSRRAARRNGRCDGFTPLRKVAMSKRQTPSISSKRAPGCGARHRRSEQASQYTPRMKSVEVNRQHSLNNSMSGRFVEAPQRFPQSRDGRQCFFELSLGFAELVA
jgi:hypothetical protein